MSNAITPRDAYQIMNAIVSEATGRTDISVIDTSSFTAAAELLARQQYENTIGAITTVIARTIFSVRPYKGSFDSLRVSQERWGAVIRKIVPLYNEAEMSQDWNTATNTDQLDDGTSVDMFKIRKPKAIQLNIYGTELLQKHITMFRDQLAQAFHNETEFMNFIDAVMVQWNNELELLHENKARLTLLNYMAGISSMGLYEVDLVAEYNTRYGTTKTRDELLGGDLESFMKFVASTIKTYSRRLEDMSTLYHANISGKEKIMRHTPKARQKMFMYEPLFLDAEANVYSALFNPQYLDIGTFEGVNFWQSQTSPTEINIKPNILDVSTGNSKTSENAVELDYVLGVLFDEEACGVMPQFDYASNTPFNSAGGYYNAFIHERFCSYVDYSENGILFVLGEGGE